MPLAFKVTVVVVVPEPLTSVKVTVPAGIPTPGALVVTVAVIVASP
jgi:hypothetical protein